MCRPGDDRRVACTSVGPSRKAVSYQLIERDAPNGHVAPVLVRGEIDPEIALDHFDRLDFEKGDLTAILSLVRVEARLIADHVAVLDDPLACDEVGL